MGGVGVGCTAARRPFEGGAREGSDAGARVASSARAPASSRRERLPRRARKNAATCSGTRDLQLAPGVEVFGTVHGTRDVRAAERVLQLGGPSGPGGVSAAVLETALSAAQQDEWFHGLTLEGATQAFQGKGGLSHGLLLATVCSAAYKLRGGTQAAQLPGAPPGGVLDTMQYDFAGEALTAVAAFAVGAPAVYGDRPLLQHFLRLYAGCDVRGADAAFGRAASTAWYRYLVGETEFVGAPTWADVADDPAPQSSTAFERVHYTERDRLIAHAIRRARDQGGADRTVVAVVGAAHLDGVAKEWADVVRLGVDEASADVARLLALSPAWAPRPTSVGDEGAKWAILEATLTILSERSLVDQFNAVLDEEAEKFAAGNPAALPVATRFGNEGYELAQQLYDPCVNFQLESMTHASLDRAQLAKLISASRSSNGLDLFAALEPLRAARPSLDASGRADHVSALRAALEHADHALAPPS